ncbi:MAG TPA: hypothetical protein VFY71_03095 [Planctomycetota bacterium]|nr:hypothetical protein [Planctomycetota bacterium]
MSLRPIVALAASMLLAGFALRPDVRPVADIDPVVFRANLERWQTLPEPEREALRERYARFCDLTPGEQEALQQRADMLARVRGKLAQRQGHDATPDETAAELVRLVERARRAAPLPPGTPEPTDAEFLAQMENRTRRSVAAFLDRLARRGDITPQQLAHLRAQTLPEQLRDALLLLKSEQINLCSETVPAAEADELMRLPPLDVASRADRLRQQRGFLGRLGTAVPLTEDDRKSLATDDGEPEIRERLRDLKGPDLRDLLSRKGVPSEQIDALLSGPVNALEGDLNDLLAHSGSR